jgi:hypothetical protein
MITGQSTLLGGPYILLIAVAASLTAFFLISKMLSVHSRPQTGFPVVNTIGAFLIAPALPLLILFIVGEVVSSRHVSPFEHDHGQMPWWIGIWLVPVPAIIMSWPGYLSFLVLGIPTLYILYGYGHTGYIICALFGALYCSIAVLFIMPWPAIQFYAPLGALSGIVTKLIVFGRNPNKCNLTNH